MKVQVDNTFVQSAQVLVCPECGFQGGLHHAGVTIYDRDEDAEFTRVTICVDAVSVEMVASARCSNPSSRRHGLAIGFWCECCSLHAELTIAQHKGITELCWRQLPSPDADVLAAMEAESKEAR
jgi:hypothetical protein